MSIYVNLPDSVRFKKQPYVISVLGSRSVSAYLLDKFTETMKELINELVNIKLFNNQFDVEFISGGAKGIDSYAKDLVTTTSMFKFTEILPDYEKYGRSAPIIRNNEIIEKADEFLIFWDGKSKGTKYVMDKVVKLDKIYTIYTFPGV